MASTLRSILIIEHCADAFAVTMRLPPVATDGSRKVWLMWMTERKSKFEVMVQRIQVRWSISMLHL